MQKETKELIAEKPISKIGHERIPTLVWLYGRFDLLPSLKERAT